MQAPDYSNYSLALLEDALANIDKEQYLCVALP